jgi:hypothetical protein
MFTGKKFREYMLDHRMGSDDESEDEIDYARKMKKLQAFRNELGWASRNYKLGVEDILEPGHVVSKKRLKSVCAQCGKTDTKLKRFDTFTCHHPYSVCVEGECSAKFKKAPLGWRWYDLSEGLPYIMETDSEKDIALREKYCCEIPVPMCTSVYMVCAYCGNNNKSEVVAHPRIPRPYKWNVFCKNKVCFKKFITYSDALVKLRACKKVPNAIFEETSESLDIISEKTRGKLDLWCFLSSLDLATGAAKHPSVVAAAAAAAAAAEAEAKPKKGRKRKSQSQAEEEEEEEESVNSFGSWEAIETKKGRKRKPTEEEEEESVDSCDTWE